MAFVSVVVWISTTDHLAATGAWLGAVLLALLVATLRRDRGLLGRSLISALIAAALTVALFLVFDAAPGGSPIRIGSLSSSSGSILAGVRMAARLVSLVLAATLFVARVDALRLSAGVTKLLLPLSRAGVPVLHVFYFSYFLISMTPLLVDESRVIRLAQRSRGWDEARGLLSRIRSSGALVLPTLNAGLRRGDQIALALSARGFHPSVVPSVITRLRLGAIDWIALALVGAGWVLWWVV